MAHSSALCSKALKNSNTYILEQHTPLLYPDINSSFPQFRVGKLLHSVNFIEMASSGDFYWNPSPFDTYPVSTKIGFWTNNGDRLLITRTHTLKEGSDPFETYISTPFVWPDNFKKNSPLPLSKKNTQRTLDRANFAQQIMGIKFKLRSNSGGRSLPTWNTPTLPTLNREVEQSNKYANVLRFVTVDASSLVEPEDYWRLLAMRIIPVVYLQGSNNIPDQIDNMTMHDWIDGHSPGYIWFVKNYRDLWLSSTATLYNALTIIDILRSDKVLSDKKIFNAISIKELFLEASLFSRAQRVVLRDLARQIQSLADAFEFMSIGADLKENSFNASNQDRLNDIINYNRSLLKSINRVKEAFDLF